MNGDVLKKVFLIIVVTLCAIATLLTADVLIGKFPIDAYEKVMEILGIPTIIGMIVTSFIHANISNNETGGSNVEKTTITSTVATATPASPSPDSAK